MSILLFFFSLSLLRSSKDEEFAAKNSGPGFVSDIDNSHLHFVLFVEEKLEPNR